VARLDQDDLARADRIATQVAYLDDQPSVALLGSPARLINEQSRVIGAVRRPLSPLAIRWYSLLENPLIHSSVMFRLAAAMDLGGYDASLAYAEDYDLWRRLLDRYQVTNLSEPLVDYRRWSSSMMSSVEEDAASPGRARLHQIMAMLVGKRIDGELGEPRCSELQAELLSTFTLGVPRDRRREFLDLLTSLRRRFERKWPNAPADSEYRRALADQYDAIAYRMQPSSRTAAIAVYWHACLHAPVAAASMSWGRAAALVALGRHGRQRAAMLGAR
jgi:hypothetical protein